MHQVLRPKQQKAIKDNFKKFTYTLLKSRPPILKVIAIYSLPYKQKPYTKYQPKNSNSNQSKEARDPITKELNYYLNSPVVKRLVRSNKIKININIINWWFNYYNKYPVFNLIAFNFATVPLKSSNLECKFGNTLNIFIDKYNSLKLNIIKVLMLLKSGLREGL